MKNKNKVIVLSILIVLITIVSVISISYAYWARVIVGSNNNVISSSCLNVSYRELSDAISLNRVGPNQFNNDYSFSIINTCNIPVTSDINLETLEGSNLDSSYIDIRFRGYNLGDNSFDTLDSLNDYINDNNLYNDYFASIDENNTYILNGLEIAGTTLDNAIYSNKLLSYKFEPGTNYYFILNTFLDSDAPFNETVEKTWNGKIVVNTSTRVYYDVYFDANGGNVNLTSKQVYSNEVYGDLPIPTRDGYLFKYWYLENDESKVITDTTVMNIYSNHTLKAKWIDRNNKSILNELAFTPIQYSLEVNSILPYMGVLSSEELNSLLDVNLDAINPNDWNLDTNRIAWKVSRDDSIYPTYLIYDHDNNNLYYYSDAEIYLTRERFGNPDPYWATGEFNYYGYNPYNLDLSFMNTSLVTDMSYMFACTRIESLDLSNFDTSNVINMAYMFYDSDFKSLDVSNFNTSNVTNFKGMFMMFSDDINSLDVSNFNTSNAVNMYGMFSGLYSIDSLDVSNFDTSNVTDMGLMFGNCDMLTSLDLSNFNTYKVTDIHSMFDGCDNLTSLNISSFDTSNVTNMHWTFYNCKSLVSLDLSHFKTSKVTDMSGMFYSCSSLTNIYVSERWNTSNVTSSYSMFYDCNNLPNYNKSYTNISRAHYNTGGYLTYKAFNS